jgi:acid phosphatase (class A)
MKKFAVIILLIGMGLGAIAQWDDAGSGWVAQSCVEMHRKSVSLVGCEKEIEDKRTTPDLYYLEDSQVANSMELLPPPPEAGSIMFLYDEACYKWGKLQRNTPRGDQAMQDARVDGDGIPLAFSEAFGIDITKEATPEIHKLVLNMREDAGDLATRHAKEHYMRIRPFAFYNEETCNPEQQKELSTNGSYPSGHASIGWATALVLAEINTDRQNEILKRGFEMGQSRVICGYHFQSDVDAARIVASAVVARLHADSAFMAQLKRAKDEFAKLLQAGKIKNYISINYSLHRCGLYKPQL